MRYTVLTLGLALALPWVGAWAQNTQDNGPATQAPQTNPAPPNATPANPDQANPAPPDQAQPAPAQPAPAEANPAPPAPTQPNPPPPANPPAPAPGAATQPAAPAAMAPSPLQEFVSQQSDEIGTLANQIDTFKAANRPELVRVLQHMIRDHVLVQNAAQNVLARRNQVSAPASRPNAPMANTPAENAPAVNAPASAAPMPNAPAANTPEELVRQDLQAHEQALSQAQQLLSSATTPEERSIYQQAVTATQRHRDWLRSIDQGQQVALGYFGPTAPLSRIAGYREAMAPSGGVSNRARTAGYRARTRRHHRVRRGMRRHRRSRYYRY